VTKLRAFHGDPAVKEKYINRVRAHAAADEIAKGFYWEHGRGCAVGCTIHGDDHERYETVLGIPEGLALLEDYAFEALALRDAKKFPLAFLEAIAVGADLSGVEEQMRAWVVGEFLETATAEAVKLLKPVEGKDLASVIVHYEGSTPDIIVAFRRLEAGESLSEDQQALVMEGTRGMRPRSAAVLCWAITHMLQRRVCAAYGTYTCSSATVSRIASEVYWVMWNRIVDKFLLLLREAPVAPKPIKPPTEEMLKRHADSTCVARSVLQSRGDGDVTVSTVILSVSGESNVGFSRAYESLVLNGRFAGLKVVSRSDGIGQGGFKVAVAAHNQLFADLVDRYIASPRADFKS
jgi:hypothetical protein